MINVKKDKTVLYVNIFLLVVFLPLSIYGFSVPKEENYNPNKDFYYEGSLYFYDIESLKGTYKCITDNCSYAKPVLENKLPSFASEEENEKFGFVHGNYALINDGSSTILYDYTTEYKLGTFNNIKYPETINYSGLVFLYNGTNWGAMNIISLQVAVPYEYTYLGTSYEAVNIIYAEKDTNKYLINSSNNVMLDITNYDLLNYNDNHAIVKADTINILDIKTSEAINEYNIKEYLYTNNYHIVITDNNLLLIYSELKSEAIHEITLPSYTSVSITENEGLEIYLDNNLFDTVTF